jgi:hypothetical protein
VGCSVGAIIKGWGFGKVRYSTLSLLSFVTLVAVACAALTNASREWAAALFTIVILAFLASVFGAVWLKGAVKASWFGFAVGCGVYAGLTYGPGLSETVKPGLPTFLILDYLYPLLESQVPAHTVNAPDGTLAEIRNGVTYVSIPFRSYFDHVGNALSILLIGLIGAYMSRAFYSQCARGRKAIVDDLPRQLPNAAPVEGDADFYGRRAIPAPTCDNKGAFTPPASPPA